jgi:hypothetical protein
MVWHKVPNPGSGPAQTIEPSAFWLGETLLLYVVATTQVISAALVVEQEETRHL